MSFALEVLEVFAEAQGRWTPDPPAAPPPGFIVPQLGKSGLSRGAPTEAEKRSRRAEYARRDYQKRMADPAKAERVRELRRERVRRWRAKQKAATGGPR